MNKTTFLILSVIFISIGFFSRIIPNHNQPNCANSISCIKNLETQVENSQIATFLGKSLEVPQINLAQETIDTNTMIANNVLGDTTSNPEDKHIYVDLSKQTLYAYENNEQYFKTLVSTGKWGKTPTGDFKIWVKIRATKMSGGSGNDYYYLPNVPYVMFFYNDQIPKSRGYGLHGTYWHNNFGHEMSHGCVNLRTIDAKTLYEWTTPDIESTTTYATKDNPGTALTICNSLEIIQGELPKCLE